jgi:XTP/dITP diphosphohydrolase
MIYANYSTADSASQVWLKNIKIIIKIMPTLLIASGNAGKLREFEAILANICMGDVRIHLVLPKSMGIDLDVVEDGSNYAENAAKKALAYARASGLIALADDSGLEVDALGGQPGLYSARYAPWPGATDADRRQYLLQNLRDHPRPWLAHFHCTIAIATPQGDVYFAEGDCPGEIIPEERGANGFGYDPVFYLAEYQKTMAELPESEKNRLSHRARAAFAAVPILKRLFTG